LLIYCLFGQKNAYLDNILSTYAKYNIIKLLANIIKWTAKIKDVIISTFHKNNLLKCCLFKLFFVYLDNILSIMAKYSINKLPADILKITAKNMAKLRRELKWTQQDLADNSGVSYGSIKRFERLGKISFESLLKIAEALNRLDEFESLFLPKSNERLEKLFKS